MSQQPISEESKIRLIENSQKTTERLGKTLDKLANMKTAIPELKKIFEKKFSEIENNEGFSQTMKDKLKEDYKWLDKNESILGNGMMICLLYMDLAAATKFHLLAKNNYEAVYAAKQINVIINEGYKRIYHFESNKKHRGSSFWIKDIQPLMDDFPSLKGRFNEISLLLDELRISLPDREDRDLSVHYDHDVLKVYNMLFNMNIDGLFKKAISFMDMLEKMFLFINDILDLIQQRINLGKKKNTNQVDNLINMISKIKQTLYNGEHETSDKVIDLLEKIKKMIS